MRLWPQARYFVWKLVRRVSIRRTNSLRLHAVEIYLHEKGKFKSHQYAILDAACRRPMEHASAVVLHLGLLEVKVLRLVVRDANLQLPVLLLVCWLVRWPATRFCLEMEL